MFRRILIVFLLGFSSGLPFALVGSTLQAWYVSQGLSIQTIGLIGLASQPYALRFLWAPLMDRFIPNRLGRRKGWLLLCQLTLVGGLLTMTALAPATHSISLALLAFFLAFVSASQDIVIDAYRAEILHESEKGLGATAAVFGYRMATLFSGGMSLIMAQWLGWQVTYSAMAVMMGMMIFVTLSMKEPTAFISKSQGFRQIFIAPFKELITRKQGVAVIMFILCYKLGEAFTTTSSGMSTVFLINGLGFDLATVGLINKIYGIAAVMLGSLLAGIIMLRVKLFNALFAFGLLQALTNLLFIVLALSPKNTHLLIIAVISDNLAAGMGTTALVALLMWWCNKSYSASQFALLSAIASIPRIFANPFTGYLQPIIGWVHFYELAFLLALPCLLLLYQFKSLNTQEASVT